MAGYLPDTPPFSFRHHPLSRIAPHEAPRNRLMGSAGPEQDDPRDPDEPAAEASPPPRAAGWEVTTAMARDLVFLLQLAAADLSQQEREGTFYFMIPRTDLVHADFSHAIASYQQT